MLPSASTGRIINRDDVYMKEYKIHLPTIGVYDNGNYHVALLKDGTKIRYNDLDGFVPEKPESIDLKITNYCPGVNGAVCPNCHEKSNPSGKHGDIMNLKFLDTMLPYSEVAIGGGNPLDHPDLIPFLEKLRDLNLVANMTVNQWSFERDWKFIDYLVANNLVWGLGVSVNKVTDNFIRHVKYYKNSVVHTICGITPIEQYEQLRMYGMKILMLGYKRFGRGANLYIREHENIDRRIEELRRWLPSHMDGFKCVSFDNLAIEQLGLQSIVSERDWNVMYMGDEGFASMYVDAVEMKYARNSTSTVRYTVEDDIKTMFDKVRS